MKIIKGSECNWVVSVFMLLRLEKQNVFFMFGMYKSFCSLGSMIVYNDILMENLPIYMTSFMLHRRT